MASPWATVAQTRARQPVPASLDDAGLGRAVAVASDLLHGLTGVQPTRTVTVELDGTCTCDPRLMYQPGVSSAGPFVWRVTPGLPVADGTCHHRLLLPDSPVLTVRAVTIDGTLLAPDAYRLVGDEIARTDLTPWAGRTLTVTYDHGGQITEAALLAVTALAVEIGKAGVPGEPCALPQRVTSLTRQGVSMTLLDPQDFLADGRTGVYLVDLWLTSLTRRRTPTRVLSPDLPSWTRSPL